MWRCKDGGSTWSCERYHAGERWKVWCGRKDCCNDENYTNAVVICLRVESHAAEYERLESHYSPPRRLP